jgi:antitoxin (DNA-binding transcriptional repressor) of toxin-antitoxin stability system
MNKDDNPLIVNIAEAKAQLSRLIDRVCRGEKVVIARNNQPVADLVVHVPSERGELGIFRGRLEVPPEMLAGESGPDPEIEEMFYGPDDGDR